MTGSAEVIVVGSGPAGVAAACAAADNGANVTLVEAHSFPGGELVSGLPVDGCLNARGQWLVGGPAQALFQGCRRRGGYIGPLFDRRLNWGVCIDPVAMRLSIVEELTCRRVRLMLGSIVHNAAVRDGRITTIDVVQRQGRVQLMANVFVDASGDGTLAVLAGTEYEQSEGIRGNQGHIYTKYNCLDGWGACEVKEGHNMPRTHQSGRRVVSRDRPREQQAGDL